MNNMSLILKDIIVYDPKINSKLPIRNIWNGNKIPLVLIHWFRRFGCPTCRLVAFTLSSYIKTLNEKVPECLDYIGIGLSLQDYQEFVDNNYFLGGKILIDEDKSSYKALNFNVKSVFSFLSRNLF